MSGNKSLEEQGIASNDSSSKFIGVSLIFHALLVLLIVYLNFPAIKQKFNPEPESVAVELKDPTPAPIEVRKPAAVAPEVEKAVAKDVKKIAKLRIEEFKQEEEKLTESNISSTTSTKPAISKKTVATKTENESEVLVPKATITEISETPVNDDAEIPMESTTTSKSASLQQMARSELTEETVEKNTSRTNERPAPEQIRAVANLRQRPGNPLPAYTDFERLRRHEGQVTYLAYVTADGSLRDFILSESSGHANLDQKTLSALRGWRFYPGQEGWVEIPQIWVLSGQPEELPSQLRR